MTTKMQQARDLFFNSGKTQKSIALEVGVSERTVQYWAKQNQWQRLREAAYHMPAIISDNLSAQIVELQNDVNSREPGKRYPTIQEAEILRKMINSLEKMKRYPSMAMYQEVFRSFRDYVRPSDSDFTWNFHTYEERFLAAKAVNGFHPWEMEYAAEHTPHIDPLDETEVPAGEKPVSCDAPQPGVDTKVIHKTDFIPQPAISPSEASYNIVSQLINNASPAPLPPEIIRKNPQDRTPRIFAFRSQSR